jgi:gliding motility-associated-like protein
MRLKYLITILVNILFNLNWIISQCIPPSSDKCEDANIICSLDELNGYTCQNPNYSNPTGCSPLCPAGGGAHNTGWWAFVCDGGPVTLSLTFTNCSVNGTGVQMGVWGDCNCIESIVCNPACNGPGKYTLAGNLTACKTYYLFVDGCSGDICDFTIETSGGSTPIITPIGDVKGPAAVCVGACSIEYSINTGGPCTLKCQWSLDGIEIGNESGIVHLDFPDEGVFELCVTAYIGIKKSGSNCDQFGCKKIMVQSNSERYGETIFISNTATPYFWQGIQITKSGSYRKTIYELETCCKYDSIVNFVVFSNNNIDLIITPNEDGYNDYFQIDFPFTELVNFHVYDKWGTRVFYESNFANRWFGTSNKGEKLENGVYSYLVTNMTEKTIQKGTITIKK